MRGIFEFLKILLLCIAAAIVYGIVHDQFTACICLEYFTVFHPQIFPTQSPTLLAIGWGILATWWVGAFLGVLLGIAGEVALELGAFAAELCWIRGPDGDESGLPQQFASSGIVNYTDDAQPVVVASPGPEQVLVSDC